MQTYRAALSARTFRSIRPTFVPTISRVTQVRRATQDYGSGAGNPAGEDPKAQGGQPSSDVEHPGPAPPDVGQKNAGAQTHGDNTSSSSSSSGSSSSGGSEGKTPASSDMTGREQSKNSAQPKINTEPQDQDTEAVRKHNDEVDRRRGGSHASKDDEPVERGFHSGQGGIAQGTGDGPK